MASRTTTIAQPGVVEPTTSMTVLKVFSWRRNMETPVTLRSRWTGRQRTAFPPTPPRRGSWNLREEETEISTIVAENLRHDDLDTAGNPISGPQVVLANTGDQQLIDKFGGAGRNRTDV